MNEKDDEYLEFLNNLQCLTKDELIDLISEYWNCLKNESQRQIKDKKNFRQEDYGRLKLTQVNRLKILLKYKVDNKI